MAKERRSRPIRQGSGASSGAARRANPDPLLVQVDALIRRGDLAHAEAMTRGILSTSARDHAALHLMGVILVRLGNRSAAIEFFHRAIAINDRIAAYHGNLGNAYLESESPRPLEAARCFRRALALEPVSVLARFGLGLAMMAQGDHHAAAAELEVVARARPEHGDTHRNLGIALTEVGRLDEAIAHCSRAVALQPDYAGNHATLASALRLKGDLAAAHVHLVRAIKLGPERVESYAQLAMTLRALGREADAQVVLGRALTLRPETSEGLCQLGGIYLEMGRFDQAIDSYERALAIDPCSAAAYRGIGRVRFSRGLLEDSRTSIARALELEPENAANYAAMGQTYQTEGRFEEAIAWQRKAIARQPNNSVANYTLSMMRGASDREERIRELERALAERPLPPEQAVSLQFALGKVYDEDGDYDAAFRCFKAGNDLRKARQRFVMEEEVAFIDATIATFRRELFAEIGSIGNPSDRPIFVVGMMRSGTTLVEQILASHPQIHGHGELEQIRWLAQSLVERSGTGRPYPECVTAIRGPLVESLAAEYLAALERDAGMAIRSVDKMPHNFRYLGLIALLFPAAKLIHCVRNPGDTCLSNYCQDFGIRHAFTCDLEQLGRYHRLYRRLMGHWHDVLPIPILDVPYEDLVADQEAWSRKIVDFVGVAWDARCLDYHKTDRPVLTSSFWQVRQPIYSSSIGRWRHYEKHLGPLLGVLGELDSHDTQDVGPSTFAGRRHDPGVAGSQAE